MSEWETPIQTSMTRWNRTFCLHWIHVLPANLLHVLNRKPIFCRLIWGPAGVSWVCKNECVYCKQNEIWVLVLLGLR